MKAILTYHSLDDSGSPISVRPETFAGHLKWLASGAVRVTTLEELHGLPADTDAVAITFDDGFASVGAVAAPLLAQHGLPATVFVVTDHVGGTNAWRGSAQPGIPTLPLLDWHELARLAEQGFTLGSHGRTHARLAGASGVRLADEVAGSAERLCAETGRIPRAFAYPYGSVDAAARLAVGGGYALACTTELRVLREGDDSHLLPRLDMYYFRAPGSLERWGTAKFRRRLWLRAQARRVRRQLAVLGRTNEA